jgi:hypothetical protein
MLFPESLGLRLILAAAAAGVPSESGGASRSVFVLFRV